MLCPEKRSPSAGEKAAYLNESCFQPKREMILQIRNQIPTNRSRKRREAKTMGGGIFQRRVGPEKTSSKPTRDHTRRWHQ